MTTEPPVWLLITGVPGSGKSYFLKWLERNRGFRVVRYDDDSHLVDPILRLAARGALDEARAVLRGLAQRVAIEFGFPPDRAIPHVEALLGLGVSGWWFDADYPSAYRSYKAREENSPDVSLKMEAFYRQVGAIAAHRPEIERLFAGRTIEVLTGDEYLPEEEIWALVSRKARPK